MNDDELRDVMEWSMALMPEVPGRLAPLPLPGARGRVTDIPHPFANGVCYAEMEPDTADERIAAIRDYYFQRGLPFHWVTGPASRPADIRERLAKAGLVKNLEMAGLVLRDLTAPFPHDPAIRVEEFDVATPDILPTLTHVAATGFDLPEPVARLFSEAYLSKADFRIRGYLASLPDADEPGAFGASMYIPNAPVLLLCGAATIPEQRGKGLYQALVARRLADAVQDGLQCAIIQAVRATSAPILMKRGFAELSNLEMWVAAPD